MFLTFYRRASRRVRLGIRTLVPINIPRAVAFTYLSLLRFRRASAALYMCARWHGAFSWTVSLVKEVAGSMCESVGDDDDDDSGRCVLSWGGAMVGAALS
jgi:hypothetical protein